MNESEIRQVVVGIFSKIAPGIDYDEIDAEEDLRDEIDIDSMDFLNFIVALNEKIGIDIPEKDYGKLVSLNDILEYVKANAPAKPV